MKKLVIVFLFIPIFVYAQESTKQIKKEFDSILSISNNREKIESQNNIPPLKDSISYTNNQGIANILTAKNPEDIGLRSDYDIADTYSVCYPRYRGLYAYYDAPNLNFYDLSPYYSTISWIIEKYIPIDGLCDVNENPQENWNNRSNPTYFTEEDFKYIQANKDPRSNKFELKKGRKTFNFEWNDSDSIDFVNLKKFSANLRNVSFEVGLNNCFMNSYKVNYKKGRKKYHFTTSGDFNQGTYESEDGYGNKWVLNKSNKEYYYEDVLLTSIWCDSEKNQKIFKSFDANGRLYYQSITTKFDDNLAEDVEISCYSDDGALVARTKFLDDMDEYISNDKIFKFDIFKINKNSQEEFIKSVSFASISNVDINRNTEGVSLEEQTNPILLERKKLEKFEYPNQIDIIYEIFKLLNQKTQE